MNSINIRKDTTKSLDSGFEVSACAGSETSRYFSSENHYRNVADLTAKELAAEREGSARYLLRLRPHHDRRRAIGKGVVGNDDRPHRTRPYRMDVATLHRPARACDAVHRHGATCVHSPTLPSRRQPVQLRAARSQQEAASQAPPSSTATSPSPSTPASETPWPSI